MKILAPFLFLILPVMVFSQSLSRQVVASGGAFESSSNLSLAYTAGEPAIETFSQSSLILTQGFQQTNPANMMGIQRSKSSLNVNAYPNPTNNRVILELNGSNEQEVAVRVFDFLGRMIAAPIDRKGVAGKRTFRVDLSGYSTGTYIIGLTNGQGKRLHTVTVQKVQ